ncbi:MAG: GIY-YIG nuclease family protein [Candidatus Omnitrophota bacterium]
MWYVYVLRSAKDNFLYIGSTNDLNRRIEEHENGICASTRLHCPFELAGYFALRDRGRAIEFEKYLKTGSGKAFLSKRIL